MDTSLAHDLGRVGIWSTALRSGDPARGGEIAETAKELETLGYGTLWVGGSPSVEQVVPLLDATTGITVATGILSIWEHEPTDVAAAFTEVNAAHEGRFVLGLGVSHSALTDRYRRPVEAMVRFLDALDDAPTPVPAERRVLAALGPRMLRLARDRAAGAHPYLVTSEHTATARELLGEAAVLAPEFKVVLDTDAERARARARAYLSGYLQLENYVRSFRRLGFGDEDFADGGGDRLLDAVFAIGDAETIARKVNAFFAGGANHVALQVVTDDTRGELPLDAYRALAPAFGLGGGA
ncbi:LLM class F420-dependent oxidoreductase [Streptomyces radicis]|uniref:LLM class F420-dependent oxidoreductase n=1 Tax=Streptomyces radicis TaxID=1750517 RepID=A0A3A9W236_9ACTN|nr:LLM class F420-dependent oxidoreductase [Streptomyces radicis]RKN07208.1 LLM class F420-dependent oxidoreductase [Streptomyces radicis]RKN26774.1 LLM class F420-dependent oxidoreductase [Streptomyces radicis]